MRLLNGWFCPDRAEGLAEVEGWGAVASCYVRVSHRILVVSLNSPGSAPARRFLVLINCKRIEMPIQWTVENLRVTRRTEDSLIVEDLTNRVFVDCYAGRLFDEDEFKRWLGEFANLETLANPGPADLRALLARNTDTED